MGFKAGQVISVHRTDFYPEHDEWVIEEVDQTLLWVRDVGAPLGSREAFNPYHAGIRTVTVSEYTEEQLVELRASFKAPGLSIDPEYAIDMPGSEQ